MRVSKISNLAEDVSTWRLDLNDDIETPDAAGESSTVDLPAMNQDSTATKDVAIQGFDNLINSINRERKPVKQLKKPNEQVPAMYATSCFG